MHIAEDDPGVEYVVVSHAMQPWPTGRINVSGAVFRHALLPLVLVGAPGRTHSPNTGLERSHWSMVAGLAVDRRLFPDLPPALRPLRNPALA